jgi:hypothetical protein
MGAPALTGPAAGPVVGRVATATTGSRPAIAAGGGDKRDVPDVIIGAVVVLAILALLFLAYRRLRGR